MADIVIEYLRGRHAAHYLGSKPGHPQGHDLESWVVNQPFSADRPEGVPADAEKHSGFLVNGVAHTRFVRIAPLSPGFCPRCAPLRPVED